MFLSVLVLLLIQSKGCFKVMHLTEYQGFKSLDSLLSEGKFSLSLTSPMNT